MSTLGISATMVPLGIIRSTKPVSKVLNECVSFKSTKGVKEASFYIMGKTGEPVYKGCVKLKNKLSSAKQKFVATMKAHFFGVDKENKKAIERNKELKELFDKQ